MQDSENSLKSQRTTVYLLVVLDVGPGVARKLIKTNGEC